MAVLAFYVRHMTMVVFCPRPFDVGCRAIRPPDRQWCTKGSMPLVHHVAPHTLPSRIGIDRCGPVGALSEVVLLIVCHIRHTQAGLQAFPAGVCGVSHAVLSVRSSPLALSAFAPGGGLHSRFDVHSLSFPGDGSDHHQWSASPSPARGRACSAVSVDGIGTEEMGYGVDGSVQ